MTLAICVNAAVILVNAFLLYGNASAERSGWMMFNYFTGCLGGVGLAFSIAATLMKSGAA